MSDMRGKKVCLGSDYDRNIGYIEEILVIILTKLPTKHVVKCKVVSKMWNDLISDQHFSKLQFSYSLKNPKLLTCCPGHESHDPDPDTSPCSKLCVIEVNGRKSPLVMFPHICQNSPFELVCSFNGLVCCTSEGRKKFEIQICNPITRELQVLPNGSPSVITPSVGIVFDPKNHKYKVLRFFLDNPNLPVTCYKCEVYVPGTGAWMRVADVPSPVPNLVYPVGPCYANAGGRLYWLVWSGSSVPKYIISVDMEVNFIHVKLPEYAFKSVTFNVYTFLVEFEDRLLLISMDDTYKYLQIWSLESHQPSSWSYVGSVRHRFPKSIAYIFSIASLKNEILFVSNPGGPLLYHMLNMDKMTWRTLRFSSKFKNSFFLIFPFSESLLKCDVTD